MKILVISDLPHFVVGGAEMQAARLVKAWIQDGHEVICLGRRMGASQVDIGGSSIQVRRIWTVQSFGRAGRAISYFLSLSLLLWRYRRWADVIYCRFLGDGAATAAICKQLGLLKTPLVATPANAGPHGDLSYLRSVPGYRLLVRLIDRQVNAVNLIAPKMEQDLRDAGLERARISKIPNGIEIEEIRRTRGADKLKLISVGRLATQKGYDVLIDALAMAPLTVESLQISVLGDGPEAESLKRRAEQLPKGLLEFEGEKDVTVVRRRLLASDLFVLPSRYEGMSNAGLEAMECGLPLVITECGGLDQFLDSSMGWVVPANDPSALSEVLAKLSIASRETLLEMGSNCRGRAEELFSMREVSRRYIALFEEVCRENCGRRTEL